jgi:hypothetical protein
VKLAHLSIFTTFRRETPDLEAGLAVGDGVDIERVESIASAAAVKGGCIVLSDDGIAAAGVDDVEDLSGDEMFTVAAENRLRKEDREGTGT